MPLPVEDEVAVGLHREPVVAVRRREPRPTLELGASHELCSPYADGGVRRPDRLSGGRVDGGVAVVLEAQVVEGVAPAVGPRAPDRPVALVDDEVPVGLHRQEGPGVPGGVGSPQRVSLPVEDEVAVGLHREPVVAVGRRQPRPTLELGASHELCSVRGPRSRRGGDLVSAGRRIARR